MLEKMEEKDLGVYDTPNMKSSVHDVEMAAKVDAMLGRMKRTYMNQNIFLGLS